MSPAVLAERFEQVLAAGQAAALRSDYGVGAGLAVVCDSTEVFFVEGNAVFSSGDPNQHAEVRVLAAAREALANPVKALRLEPASASGRRVHAYCGVEPCMLCLQSLASSGVTHVHVAVPDPRAGALLRPDRLPPRWRQLVQNMEVVVCQARRADRPGYLPAALLDELAGTFHATTGQLAPALARSGGLPGALAARLAA